MYVELSESVVLAKNWGISKARMDQMGDHMKISISKYKNECYKQLEQKK